MHKKLFCQLKFSMPHLMAACFGKSEQKSVHPFVSFGKVGARRGTFMSVVRKKNQQLLLIPSSWKGVCRCIWKCQFPFMLETGVCVLMLIYVNMVNISKGGLKLPCDYLILESSTLAAEAVDTH